MSDEPVQPPSGDVPAGESAPGSTPPAQPLPPAGGGLVASILGSQFSAYALLLVASLVTITGSMYVLSSREDSRALLQMQISPGASLATETRADFRSDAGIRTVVIQFEGGVMQQAKEKVTNLAGAITAVSTKLVDEVRAEDAARAAALAASRNAFSASEAAALVPQVQPPPPRPTTPPQAPTAAPTQAPTQAPTVVPPTQVPPTAPPAVAPTNPPPPAPTQTAAPPAPTQVPASATPVPPTATRTPEPSGGGGSGQSQSAQPAAPAAPVVPVQAGSTPVAESTAVGLPTVAATVAIPTVVATFIPTPVLAETPVPILFGLNADGGANGHASAIIPATFSFQPGIPSAQTLNFSNSGVTAISITFQAKTSSSASSTPTALWTDTTNGLQLTITQVSGGYESTLYEGPLQPPANRLTVDLGTLASGGSRAVTMTVNLPLTAPDAYQGLTQPVDLTFQIVSPPYANATATPQPTS